MSSSAGKRMYVTTNKNMLQNCPWQSDHHLIQGSLGPHESAPKRHLDRFSRLGKDYPSALHADTQSTLCKTSAVKRRTFAMHEFAPRRLDADDILALSS